MGPTERRAAGRARFDRGPGPAPKRQSRPNGLDPLLFQVPARGPAFKGRAGTDNAKTGSGPAGRAAAPETAGTCHWISCTGHPASAAQTTRPCCETGPSIETDVREANANEGNLGQNGVGARFLVPWVRPVGGHRPPRHRLAPPQICKMPFRAARRKPCQACQPSFRTLPNPSAPILEKSPGWAAPAARPFGSSANGPPAGPWPWEKRARGPNTPNGQR